MADYTQLVNQGGTVFNQAAKVAYQKPEQLAADLGISASQIDWGKIASAPANFNPAGYFGYSTPSVESLQTTQPNITVPTPNYNTTINNANGFNEGVTSTNKTLQDYINSFTPQTTQIDTKYQDLLNSITELTGQDTGKQAYQLGQENQFQVPEIKQQISDLNSQILSGLAEQRKTQADYNAANLALEQQPQQMRDVVGSKSQELQRTYSIQQASKSADIGLLQARQAALGGQLNTALDLAQRATDLRYQPIEDELKIKQAQIAAIQPLLNKQESIQAQALTAKYNDEQQRIAEQKAKAKDIINTALAAGITTRFYDYAGEIRDITNGTAYTSEKDFQQKTGMTVQQAQAQGLITDYTGTAKLLSVAEAKSLGVPYGTTQSQAIQLGLTPTSSGGGSGGGTGDVINFSDTQLAKGAAAAGMPLTEFQTLDQDTKNEYINGGFSNLVGGRLPSTEITKRQKTIDEMVTQKVAINVIREQIDNSNIPQEDKELLKKYAEEKVPKGVPWYKDIWNYIKK